MTPPAAETPIRLNFLGVAGSWLLASIGCVGGALLGAPLGLWNTEVSSSAALGAILASCVMLVGVLILGPWAARTPSEWSTRWLAATVIRFIGTPFLALLLYSRPPSAEGFLLALAGTYLVSLAVETAVIARTVLAAASTSARRISTSNSPPDPS
jgi:hypothetical protein